MFGETPNTMQNFLRQSIELYNNKGPRNKRNSKKANHPKV